MKSILLSVPFLFFNMMIAQDTIMPLWPKDNVPNHIPFDEREIREYKDILYVRKVQEPSLEVYLPSERNAIGTAMVIFPGGGYQVLAYDWEGSDIAKYLNGKGIAAMVVKYRLPSDVSQKEKYKVPLMDAQRAMRLVRSKAGDFHIDPKKIGIIGFSAGGHLAATLGTHFEDQVYAKMDDVDLLSARPDFMVLGYPVITFGEFAHSGSRKALLGDNPTAEMIDYFSNEKQVTVNTPPTFLFHATDDGAVPVENSLLFYKALKDKGVSATMHIYPKGGHGFSLALKDKLLRGWTERMFEWMESLKE
ncbi:alpha/beta hydrolase [Maribacter polysaccharolyticus]|uniref:alpha/beta hydrolase n=1 Tax=Maribacter polysaccharolyticus TaxID=3020831 RepID=UPI00237F338C|nr:alpha/beta hydrolase [Maribacter polysaccharolyticus]MDE3740871.1 alpha/beta hydrolase [Maribacter polysaccharolyticus]